MLLTKTGTLTADWALKPGAARPREYYLDLVLFRLEGMMHGIPSSRRDEVQLAHQMRKHALHQVHILLCGAEGTAGVQKDESQRKNFLPSICEHGLCAKSARRTGATVSCPAASRRGVSITIDAADQASTYLLRRCGQV
jgi:hypothetical protein